LEVDAAFELIAAGFARPSVPHAGLWQIFRPFWRNYRGTTLRTRICHHWGAYLSQLARIETELLTLAALQRGWALENSITPWSVEETAACFIVKDHTRQKLAYV
jgi:hypothetical protein